MTRDPTYQDVIVGNCCKNLLRNEQQLLPIERKMKLANVYEGMKLICVTSERFES